MNDVGINPARQHDAAVARDLALLGLPAANWPATVQGPDGQPVLDVLVVGAGMNGIAAAGSLLFKGVRNLQLIDRAAPGREGPWRDYARMDTLRSPKTLPGPALGIPSLTFRAWYEANHGLAAWEAMYKIPNGVWVDYLSWLQRVLALPVRHGVTLERLEPAGRFLRAVLGDGTALARRVILATGRGGAGGNHWPSFVDAALRPDLAAHTNDAIDFARLRGASIAVLGAGSSGWDNAATALERGAARIDMYARRKYLPQVNKGRGSAFPGYLHGWATLSDAQRWELMVYLNDLQGPVPHETIHRTLRQRDFHIHLGMPVAAAERQGGKVAIVTRDGARHVHDFLIVATGFQVEPARIPELAAFAGDIASWGDRYPAPPGLERDDLALFPYLGPAFELTGKRPDSPPPLGQIHLLNYGAHASHAGIASDIPGVNIAAERIATAIATSLFREDLGAMRARIEAFNEPELAGTPFFVPEDERGEP